MTPRRMAALALLASASACSGDPEGSVSITLGEEGDALARAPAPTSLVVETVDLDGARRELARRALPADTLSLGDLPRSDVGAIAVRALDPAGAALLRGESLHVQWGALQDATLEVFLQRTGELARMPRGPGAFDANIATVAVGRYVLATDGSSTYLYDLLSLRTLDAPPTFPRVARSLATFETTALLVDEGGATAFDLQTRRAGDIAAPAGVSFAEIAGGATVETPDGTQLIVGATRLTGGPTARVLRLAPDGNLTAVSLAAAREGACATWVEGRGLFVYGGSATAPGGELVAGDAATSSSLPLPPDATTGCGAAALDGTHVLVAATEARVIDLACTTACAPTPWAGTLALTGAQAVALAPDAALVVGEDARGTTKVFRASPDGPREIALKTARSRARLVALPPAGSFAVVGGAPGIEQYLE